MNVLLSIKPKYVEKIKEGSKKFEFRKSLFNQYNIGKIKKIYIYSSSPIKKIVAKFSIDQILIDHPESLWEICKEFSGIKKVEYFDYFRNREKAFAIKIGDIEFFKKPLDPKLLFPKFTPPQSFYYIEDIESRSNITRFM